MFTKNALAAIGALLSAGAAQAIVVADSNIILNGSNGYYQITAIQSATYADPTTMWFTKQDGVNKSTLTPYTWNIDQEADYYLVKAGDVLTPESIATGAFTPLFTTDHPHVLEIPFPGDFYLGVATTGPGPIPGGTPTYGFGRNVWGWVHIQNSPTGLYSLGSAMAYGEGGIIVGTVTAVPEPSTLMLSALGLTFGFLAISRRHTRSVAPIK